MAAVTELSKGYFEEIITVFIMITLQMRYYSWQKIIKQDIIQSVTHLANSLYMWWWRLTCQQLKVL